jgi:hypothetical protein
MQSLYFLFGAWFQIRSANLLDQILDFGGIGFRNFSPLANLDQSPSHSGAAIISANHYYSLPLRPSELA